MNNFNYRIFHLRLANITYKLQYLKDYIQFLSKNEFNAVYLEFAANFPYRTYPCLKKNATYSENEIKELTSFISSLGMKIIVGGLSFSHSSSFLKFDEMKEYAEEKGSDNIDLTEKKSLDLIIRQGEDILSLIPEMDILHIGGDEIFSFGRGVKSNAQILRYGRSRIYVEFVNKIIRHFARKKIKVALWSDMIIRYHQAIDLLDKKAIIFYWDYWSYGKKIPFLTIGGGCPDTFILDRSALKRDLEKLYRWSFIREKNEIPIGHLKYFQKYIKIGCEMEGVKSFPYLQWFQDLGFKTVSCFLSYTEKGSIYPNLGEKIEHIKSFLEEGKKTFAYGYLFCLWTPYWPPLELFKLSAKSIKFISVNPRISENKLFALLEKDCDSCAFSANTIRELFFCMRHFEFADELNQFWGQTNFRDRIEFLKKSKWEKDELTRLNYVIKSTGKLLKNPELTKKDSFLKFTIEEINWRAKCQKECMRPAKFAKTKTSLLNKGINLKNRYKKWLNNYMSEESVQNLLKTRWNPLIEILK